MPSLFISHNSRDDALVVRLCEWLVEYGVTSVFLDFDPEQGVPAGAKWEAELYRQLRRSDGVLFVGSPASVASQWCFAELAMARMLGKTIVPVTIAPGGRHPLLADTQAIDCTGADGQRFEGLGDRLRRADFDPERLFAWDPRRPPFPGLGSFEERDAGVFFGRRPEVEWLLELLRSSERRHGGRLVAVVGPSGSGKSSLVRAGVVPRLRRADPPWLVLAVLRPAGRPVRQLARAFGDAFRTLGAPRPIEQIEQTLDGGVDALVELAEELTDLHAGEVKPAVLVFVDQAEELTLAGSQERERFLWLLHGATRTDGPLWALLTLRSEFLSALLQSEVGSELIDDELLVGPLNRARLAEVIERPAERAGIDFSPGLVGRMVEDTGGGDALPLLAHTLAELYRRAADASSHTVTDRDYEQLGGVVGALRTSADREHERLADQGLGDTVIPTLVKLVAIGPEGQPRRRRLPRRALSDRERRVIDAFIEARLLISGQVDGEPVVEVAHEALLRQWPPLTLAITDYHAELQLRSELERGADDWERAGRREDYLLTGERLHAARLLNRRQPDDGASELDQHPTRVSGRQRGASAARTRSRAPAHPARVHRPDHRAAHRQRARRRGADPSQSRDRSARHRSSHPARHQRARGAGRRPRSESGGRHAGVCQETHE